METSISIVDKKTALIEEVLYKQAHFEGKLSVEKRKDKGIFFTYSHKIIEHIVSIVDVDNNVYDKKILEPACGYGIYLMYLIAEIYDKYPDTEYLRKFMRNNIIFCDIEFEMVLQAQNNLRALFEALTADQYGESFNAYTIDFTEKESDNALFAENKSVLSRYYNQIDYVIGNPPYITYYGRRDRKQCEQQRINYLQNYKQFPDRVKNGKINSVMLFLERSLDLLKTNGRLAFIVDVAFFESAYLYTRKYLLENTSINELIVNIKGFEVASGQIVLKLTKTRQNKENAVGIIDFERNTQFSVKQQTWNNPADEYKFRWNGSRVSKGILEKIVAKRDPTILQLYPNKNLRTCTMLLDMEDKFTHKVKKEGENEKLVYPYYQGSKSLGGKYASLLFEKYFYYDKALQDEINDRLKVELEVQGIKNKKRIGMGELVIYDNPKIYIRQSAKEIIATLDMSKSAANNSLYCFSLRDNSDQTLQTLQFVCGILNSKLATFFAQEMNIIRYSTGKQPQIKISDLGQLPLLQDTSLQLQIASLVKKIYAKKSLQAATEIDRLLYTYYHISSDEIQYVEKSIKGF